MNVSGAMLSKFLRRHRGPDFNQLTGKYIIPVMGPSGAGKSSFINQLLGREEVKVGVSLNSCTSELQAIQVSEEVIARNLPGWDPTRKKVLILVDTPGFDDTWADDTAILKRIATWLKNAYGVKAKLAGVIYLFDMSLQRVTPTARRNFSVFKKLCGADARRSVVLGTTKWQRIPQNERKLTEAREDQLRDVFWKDMIKGGSTMRRLERSTESSWELVAAVLMKDGDDTVNLQIQVEMVDQAKALSQTEAAIVLKKEILEAHRQSSS